MKVVTARIGDLNLQILRKAIGALAIATITALVLTSCSLIPGANKALKSIEQYQSQSLKWGKCYETFTCAYLKVPIDYTNLELGTFKIALIKYKATKPVEKLGSIVVNPGGPGASGVDYAYNAEYIFNESVLEKYDLVGFDPRGISRSEAIMCLNDKETDASFAADSKPDSPAEFAARALISSMAFLVLWLSIDNHNRPQQKAPTTMAIALIWISFRPNHVFSTTSGDEYFFCPLNLS
jgi:hypothetical protein